MPFFDPPDPKPAKPAGAPPNRAGTVIALAIISAFAIVAGVVVILGGIADAAPAEAQIGASCFIGGWFLAGLAYAVRRLQLIEWHLRGAKEPASSSNSDAPAL